VTDEPMDDYLWDRSGDEDAEVRDLERLLARYRHDEPLRLAGDGASDGDESGT
jgi:hypothetical protein